MVGVFLCEGDIPLGMQMAEGSLGSPGEITGWVAGWKNAQSLSEGA